MKLRSTAAVIVICALVLTLAKLQTSSNQLEKDDTPAIAVRKKMNAEGVRKSGHAKIAGSDNTKSSAFGAHIIENQTNPEVADDTLPLATGNEGDPALRNIIGITNDERWKLNEQLISASSTPDTADDRTIMREIHRLSSESLSSISNESDNPSGSPMPNP